MLDTREQRYTMKLFIKSNEKQLESYRQLKSVYGNACMKKSARLRWHSKFQNGRESRELEGHPGVPVAGLSEETINTAYLLIANLAALHHSTTLADTRYFIRHRVYDFT